VPFAGFTVLPAALALTRESHRARAAESPSRAWVLCGGAGLILAQAIVFPGRSTRLRNLADRGREAGIIVIGSVVMFFIAGLIEGIFRQTVQSVPARYTVAGTSAVLWILYFSMVGRRRHRDQGGEA